MMNPMMMLITLTLAGAPSGQNVPAVTAASVLVPDPADRALEQAQELFMRPNAWARAASLLERSAELRSADHPKRASTFVLSGNAYWAAKDLSSAERAYIRAGDAAMETGAILTAALAYLNAAEAAASQGNRHTALKLIRKATLMAESPHLGAGDRTAILKRVPLDLTALEE